MALKDAWLAEYDHEMATTRKLLERVPGDRLTWKPHDKSRTIGGLAQHIANLPNWVSFILERTAFDLEDAPPSLLEPESQAAILTLFEQAKAIARKALDKQDGEFAVMWSLKRGGREMFTIPRSAALRSFVLSHLVHHRGQLSVYLRLNDVSVPAIYGASADEG